MKKILFSLSMLFTLTSCSVYMAAQEKGVSKQTLQQCKTRTCLLKHDAKLVSQKTDKQDRLTEEIYEARKPARSLGRAAAHGALDVATLGLWEAVGTPTEVVMSSPDNYLFSVKYKPNGEDIQSIHFNNK